jgi:hypothetical protein
MRLGLLLSTALALASVSGIVRAQGVAPNGTAPPEPFGPGPRHGGGDEIVGLETVGGEHHGAGHVAGLAEAGDGDGARTRANCASS